MLLGFYSDSLVFCLEFYCGVSAVLFVLWICRVVVSWFVCGFWVGFVVLVCCCGVLVVCFWMVLPW